MPSVANCSDNMFSSMDGGSWFGGCETVVTGTVRPAGDGPFGR